MFIATLFRIKKCKQSKFQGLLAKKNVVVPHNGILLIGRKEWTIDTKSQPQWVMCCLISFIYQSQRDKNFGGGEQTSGCQGFEQRENGSMNFLGEGCSRLWSGLHEYTCVKNS